MTSNTHPTNFALFRDCFSSLILHRLNLGIPKQQKRRGGKCRENAVNSISEPTPRGYSDEGDSDAEELADFIEVSHSKG